MKQGHNAGELTLAAVSLALALAIVPGARAADDPRVTAVVDAVRRLDAAILANDMDAFAAALAPEVVVNSPGNTVNHRAQVIERFAGDAIRYASYDRRVEYAGLVGDAVVVMGEETVQPIASSRDAGKTVRRRFTDLWREEDGVWRLAARQATIIAVE